METISREELKEKIDNGDDIKLCLTLSKERFDALRIPGSIHIRTPEDAMKILDRDDDIIVYCSGVDCVSSKIGYRVLQEHGFKKVRRYDGGLEDWLEAGYALEGHKA